MNFNFIHLSFKLLTIKLYNMKNTSIAKFLLIAIAGILSAIGSFAQTKTGYYYNYDYQTARFQDMTGQDLTCYGITAAVQNSVKRDSLKLQMLRYRALYPSARITAVISTDTAIYTNIGYIKNFETLKSITFDGYNLEREFWNGAGTFPQWCSWSRLIKARLGSVEAYLGKFNQAQADSIVSIFNTTRIFLHNYFKIDRWSGKYAIDNDNSRLKYLANAGYRKNKTLEVIPIIANNQTGDATGFQTSALTGAAVSYCYLSYKAAFTAASITYKNKLTVQSIQVYKKL